MPLGAHCGSAAAYKLYARHRLGREERNRDGAHERNEARARPIIHVGLRAACEAADAKRKAGALAGPTRRTPSPQ